MASVLLIDVPESCCLRIVQLAWHSFCCRQVHVPFCGSLRKVAAAERMTVLAGRAALPAAHEASTQHAGTPVCAELQAAPMAPMLTRLVWGGQGLLAVLPCRPHPGHHRRSMASRVGSFLNVLGWGTEVPSSWELCNGESLPVCVWCPVDKTCHAHRSTDCLARCMCPFPPLVCLVCQQQA